MALLKEACQLGCVSQDSPQKEAIPWEDGKLGSNHTVKFSKTTMRHAKFSGKRRVHRRESSQNVNLRSECRGLQNSRKERKMKPSGKSDAAAEQPGTWPRMFIHSQKKESQDAFYSPAWGGEDGWGGVGGWVGGGGGGYQGSGDVYVSSLLHT